MQILKRTAIEAMRIASENVCYCYLLSPPPTPRTKEYKVFGKEEARRRGGRTKSKYITWRVIMQHLSSIVRASASALMRGKDTEVT